MRDTILTEKNAQELGKTPTCVVRSHIIYINCFYLHFFLTFILLGAWKDIIIKTIKQFLKNRKLTHIKID